MRLPLVLLALLLVPATAAADPGDLDRTFGAGGTVLRGAGWETAVFPRAAGGALLLTGERLVAIDERGRRDPRYHVSRAYTAAAAGQDVLALGPGGPAMAQLRRLGPDGRPVMRYAAELRRPGFLTPILRAGAHGGALLAENTVGHTGREPTAVVRRFDAAGRSVGAIPLLGRAEPAALLPDGTAVLGRPAGVLSLRPDGTVLAEAPLRGVAVPADTHLVVLEPDRRTLLAGFVERRRRSFVVRIDPAGARVGRLRLAVPGWVAAVARDRQGRFLVAANAFRPTTGTTATIHRFTRGGRPDPRFGDRGRVRLQAPPGRKTQGVHALALDGRGRILVAASTQRRGLFLRLRG